MGFESECESLHIKFTGKRFLREARSAATLRHPNICPVYEIGEQDGRSYIVMGFIDGRPLSAYIGGEGGCGGGNWAVPELCLCGTSELKS